MAATASTIEETSTLAATAPAPARGVHNLGPASRIPPGEGRAFRIGPTAVAVFRTRAGELFATQARCPHRAGPLADGLVGGGTVVCPLHAYRFDLATGRPVGDACGALETYPVEVDPAGDVLIRLAGRA